MASQWVDVRDLQFMLHEVFKIGDTVLGKGKFADHDTDMVNMVLEQAAKFTENDIAPTYPDEVQRKPIEAVFKDGKVYAPESYHKLWKLYFCYMSLENKHEILELLDHNVSLSFDQIEELVLLRKHENRIVRGYNSEIFAYFLVTRIPDVSNISFVHDQINGLDCDFQVEFFNAGPVNVQVKSSGYGVYVFTEEMNEVKNKSKKDFRWVTINMEDSFDQILTDFIDQINNLEGRKVLKPVKFSVERPRKRKSYSSY